MQILTAKAAGSPSVVAGRKMRMVAKVARVLQPERRALQAKPGIQARSVAGSEDGGGGSRRAQVVTVASRPTLMDTLARALAGRGGEGAVSQMVTELRMSGDGKRARRMVLAARRWWVPHISAGGEGQPSITVWEALRGGSSEMPADRGGSINGADAAVDVVDAELMIIVSDGVGIGEDVEDTAAGAAEVVLDAVEEPIKFWQMPGKTLPPVPQSSHILLEMITLVSPAPTFKFHFCQSL
jgi:hypothetical protein